MFFPSGLAANRALSVKSSVGAAGCDFMKARELAQAKESRKKWRNDNGVWVCIVCVWCIRCIYVQCEHWKDKTRGWSRQTADWFMSATMNSLVFICVHRSFAYRFFFNKNRDLQLQLVKCHWTILPKTPPPSLNHFQPTPTHSSNYTCQQLFTTTTSSPKKCTAPHLPPLLYGGLWFVVPSLKSSKKRWPFPSPSRTFLRSLRKRRYHLQEVELWTLSQEEWSWRRVVLRFLMGREKWFVCFLVKKMDKKGGSELMGRLKSWKWVGKMTPNSSSLLKKSPALKQVIRVIQNKQDPWNNNNSHRRWAFKGPKNWAKPTFQADGLQKGKLD